MTGVAFRVMHAPWADERRRMLVELRKRLGAVQPPHSYKVIADASRKGVWPTCKAALISGASDRMATHVMVMQDDMHPCRDFIPALEIILSHLPDSPVVVATSRTVARLAHEAGGSWARTGDATWGGATIIPKGIIPDLLDWERRYIPKSYPHDDGRIALYLLARRIQIWHTVPSLMVHVGTRSLLGHSHSNARLPKPSLTLEQSALSVDWSVGLEDPPTSGHTTQAVTFIKTLSPDVQRDSGLGYHVKGS